MGSRNDNRGKRARVTDEENEKMMRLIQMHDIFADQECKLEDSFGDGENVTDAQNLVRGKVAAVDNEIHSLTKEIEELFKAQADLKDQTDAMEEEALDRINLNRITQESWHHLYRKMSTNQKKAIKEAEEKVRHAVRTNLAVAYVMARLPLMNGYMEGEEPKPEVIRYLATDGRKEAVLADIVVASQDQ